MKFHTHTHIYIYIYIFEITYEHSTFYIDYVWVIQVYIKIESKFNLSPPSLSPMCVCVCVRARLCVIKNKILVRPVFLFLFFFLARSLFPFVIKIIFDVYSDCLQSFKFTYLNLFLYLTAISPRPPTNVDNPKSFVSWVNFKNMFHPREEIWEKISQ